MPWVRAAQHGQRHFVGEGQGLATARPSGGGGRSRALVTAWLPWPGRPGAQHRPSADPGVPDTVRPELVCRWPGSSTSSVRCRERTPGNFDLPFLRGSAADVVDLSEHPLREVAVRRRQPHRRVTARASTRYVLQQMLTRARPADWATSSGFTVYCSSVSYDEANQKFKVTVGLSRDNAAGGAVSDTCDTSTGTSVTYADQAHRPARVRPNALAGRVVQAGTSMGYIASNTATEITLVQPICVGSRPAAARLGLRRPARTRLAVPDPGQRLP